MSDDVRKLGARFPCCDVACRHDLEVGVQRDVACPHCGRQYRALLVECAPYARQMAGRRVGKVRFNPVEARVQ